ncbi:phosphoribosylglycinamide formyltransferase 1 [Candidatus Terasakiella magnetica]|uniref:Phosphoribosylglycinamide formyltransferase n=1 Tax=Candidatus Terasakiella magnetica TaxID=1867952 RepID=A0A1C3RK25_9PROT|nr:phosphoribosylglycinamide formyltransferase [Candidatus Terasakiella magnetica]SCA57628.1 phosphoribosylglycinamide formyltransferase 1 [Candidatus Terasakiella magnetica]
MAKLRVAVLISGGGSNLQALIDMCTAEDSPAEIIRVISNVDNAYGLERAKQAGIKTTVVDHKKYNGREPFEDALHQVLDSDKIQMVCLAGFMRLLTDSFVHKWRDRLINIHPALLPSFKGLHTHERAIEAGVKFHGATVHYVRPAMDEGPIIVQAAVPVLSSDSPDDLGARVLEQEHKIYPLALKLIAERKVRVSGEKVLYNGVATLPESFMNPIG